MYKDSRIKTRILFRLCLTRIKRLESFVYKVLRVMKCRSGERMHLNVWAKTMSRGNNYRNTAARTETLFWMFILIEGKTIPQRVL